jgi:acyl-CoA synthetase (AMP-forming)/AMP-acid ligase II
VIKTGGYKIYPEEIERVLPRASWWSAFRRRIGAR